MKNRVVRTFGRVQVSVAHEHGDPVGSLVESDDATWQLPHWPSRIADIQQRGDALVVHFKDGRTRLLERADALIETTTGTSMGGHSPKAHGKIRFIVRAFGKWANGKHSVCVRRLKTEHPEVAKGRENQLCAWLKDQWMGTTKWRRHPGEDKSKYKSRERPLAARAKATAYERFTHSMPQLAPGELDFLVEAVEQMTGTSISDLLQELGVPATGGDPYELLAEHDAQLLLESEMEVAYSATRTLEDDGEFTETAPHSVADPLRRAAPEARPTVMPVNEFDLVEAAELHYARPGGSWDDLHDRARELYENSGGATAQGRQHLATAGVMELQRIIGLLESREHDERVQESAHESDYGKPTNLREGQGESRCGTCFYYEESENACGMFSHPVTEGLVCDEHEAAAIEETAPDPWVEAVLRGAFARLT